MQQIGYCPVRDLFLLKNKINYYYKFYIKPIFIGISLVSKVDETHL